MTPDKRNPIVFLAIPAGPKFGKIRTFLSTTLLKNNFDVTYIRHLEPGALIVNHVSNLIKESDIIIADITGSNSNIVFELGFSQALNKPILLIIKRGPIQEYPAIIRQYMYLEYDEKNLDALSRAINSFLFNYKKQIKRKEKK
jgi:nucleoside 2-deoxyribosyltransferase